MFGFTRLLESDAKVASKKGRSELLDSVLAIAALIGLLALGVGIRVWIFAPRFFH
jgi:hypothetical protein